MIAKQGLTCRKRLAYLSITAQLSQNYKFTTRPNRHQKPAWRWTHLGTGVKDIAHYLIKKLKCIQQNSKNMHIRETPDQAKEKPSSSIPTCMLNYFACMHIYFSQYFPAHSIERCDAHTRILFLK